MLNIKNAILLVLPIEEISLRPELSSPPRFRIQGAGGRTSVTKDGRRTDEVRTEILMSNIGLRVKHRNKGNTQITIDSQKHRD